MASFKSNPIFCSALIVIGVVVAGEGWCIFERSRTAQKNQKVLVQKRRELAALQEVNPFPNEANKAAVEADLARTQTALATMREELKGRGPTADQLRSAKVPAEPTDVFFDLANFVEKNRDGAKQAGVKIKADERFGFSAYSSAGPERELIPQVFRQRQIAQYLIEALFNAHPRELISLQRERPWTNAQMVAIAAGQPVPAAPASGGSSSTNTDLFEIDPRISARVSGFVTATAFRLTFIGETESLRTLLNKLATFELPLVVRSVEVEPSAGATSSTEPAAANSLSSIFGNAASATATPAEPAKPKPLVAKVLSKFTVTIELIDLVSTTSTAAAPTS
jgi:hypothetical protein